MEDVDNVLVDVKPKVEIPNQDNDKKEDPRAQLFKEIESLDQGQDHITLLTSCMSLKEDTPSTGHPSHQVTPPLVDNHSDTNAATDSLSKLITIYDEAVKTDHTCSTCNMLVRNKEKHTHINRCRALPFPYTNKIAKTALKQKKIWTIAHSKSGDGPTPSVYVRPRYTLMVNIGEC